MRHDAIMYRMVAMPTAIVISPTVMPMVAFWPSESCMPVGIEIGRAHV